MPLDITPERDSENPIISVLRISISQPTTQNKAMLLACISSQAQNMDLSSIAKMIKNSDIDVTKARELLTNCWASKLLQWKDDIDTIMHWVIEAYLNILVRHLSEDNNP